MRKQILVFIAFFISFNLYGIEDTTSIKQKRYLIGYSPSGIINRYPGLQLTQSFRLYPWISFDLETVFSFDVFSFERRLVKNLGYRLRPGIKFHINPKSYKNLFSVRFFGHLKEVNLHFEDDEIPRANGAYLENIREKAYTNLKGYGGSVEYQTKGAGFDFCVGLGYIIGTQFSKFSTEELRNFISFIDPGKKRITLQILYFHFLY